MKEEIEERLNELVIDIREYLVEIIMDDNCMYEFDSTCILHINGIDVRVVGLGFDSTANEVDIQYYVQRQDGGIIDIDALDDISLITIFQHYI